MKHKHADLMALYALDSLETDRPWERWERTLYPTRLETMAWLPLTDHPHWITDVGYRRIKKEERPSLGLKPKDIHDDQRYQQVIEAISRYNAAGLLVPKAWMDEAAELRSKKTLDCLKPKEKKKLYLWLAENSKTRRYQLLMEPFATIEEAKEAYRLCYGFKRLDCTMIEVDK